MPPTVNFALRIVRLVGDLGITPETDVYFVENGRLPGGVGEAGVPPTVPAICNAIYAATSKRIGALPIDPQLLKPRTQAATTNSRRTLR